MGKGEVSSDESVENVGSPRWDRVVTSYNTTMCFTRAEALDS